MLGTPLKKEMKTVRKPFTMTFLLHADECNHGAQKDAEEKADECHEEGIRDGFGDEEEGGRYDSKVYHYVVLLPLSVMRCVAWNTISTNMTSTQ